MSSEIPPLLDRSAFRALCDHVDGAGLSTEILRTLLWEINAHPDLIGLPQVCRNLQKISEAIPLAWGTPLSDWGLDHWPALIHWIAAHGNTLQAILPECDLLLKPRHPRAHPMHGRGLSRYPFYAALWCSHIDVSRQSAYELLQAHFLVAHCEAMRQHCSRSKYESEGHQSGWSPLPNVTDTFGRALRYASCYTALDPSEWIAYLDYLPIQEPPWVLAAKLRDVPPEVYGSLETHHDALRFFVEKVFADRKWIHRTRSAGAHQIQKNSVWARGYGGDGSRSIRQRLPMGDHDDPNCPLGKHECVSLASTTEREKAELFRVDDDPAENENIPLFRSLPEDADGEYPGSRVAASQAQINHVLVEHQLLPWSFTVLADEELHYFIRTSSESMQCLARKASLSSTERDHLEVLALAHVMVATGTSLERALPLVVLAPDVNSHDVEFALQLSSDPEALGSPDTDSWIRKALVPAYAKERAAAGERIRQDVLTLPDVAQASFGIRALWAYHARQVRCEEADQPLPFRPFRRPESWYRHALRYWLPRYDRTGRLTRTTLARALFFRLVQQSGGDIATAALITGEPHPLARVRLYYASHRIQDLQEKYVQAVTGLLPDRAAHAPWLPASHDLFVGSRLCPTRATLQAAIQRLVQCIHTARKATDLEGFIRYHNLYSLFTVWSFAYASGIRGIRTPYRDLSKLDVRSGMGQLRDKDNGTGRKTRLIWVTSAVTRQMQYYFDHLEAVRHQMAITDETALKPCFFLDRHGKPIEVRPKTIEPIMREFLDFPVNLHRRFLRSEMLASGCAPEVTDAWMGHWHLGEEPWGPFSSLSFAAIRRALEQHLLPILHDLGFRPLRSRLSAGENVLADAALLPKKERSAVPDTPETKKATHPAGRSDSPYVPESPFWDSEALGLSADQKVLLPAVWEWLQQQPTPAARALCDLSSASYTAADAEALDAALRNSGFNTKEVAAEYLHVLNKLIALRNERQKSGLPLLPIPLQPFEPLCPVTGNVEHALRRVRIWRSTLDSWVRESAHRPPSPAGINTQPVTLASVLLSAVLHGGLLHRSSLATLARVLAWQPEAIQCSGAQVHIELSLPWQGTPDMEKRRWYPDSLTANLLLRLAPQAVQELLLVPSEVEIAGDPGPKLTDKDIVRALWRTLSEAFRRASLPPGARPRSLTDLLDTVSLALLTELPPLLVAYANRKWTSHSIQPDAFARLWAKPTLGVPKAAPPERPPSRTGFTREKEGRISRDDLTELAPTWLKALRRALLTADLDQIREELQHLANQRGAWPPIGEHMRDFADFCFAKNASSAYQAPLSTLGTRILRVAKNLGCMVGANDIRTWSIEALELLYTQVLENASQSKAGYSRWNMTVALRAFHQFLVAVHGAPALQTRDLLRLDRGLLPVDSTIISLEEYLAILEGLDHVDKSWKTPLHPDVKRVAKCLVTLGFRCGLRRKEAQQPKMEDFCSEGRAEVLIRPSEMRDLKTPNATRKLPLFALLTGEEIDQLRRWKDDRDAQPQIQAGDFLFGIPELNFPYVPEDTVFPLIHQVMREVTQDPNVRFHHLRHSFATWTFLRLFLSDLESSPSLFPHLPQTTEWLQQSPEFRRALYGHQQVTRKHGYAVTLLLGHSAPQVSFEHYIHSVDLVLSAHLRASPVFAPAESLIALSSGEPSSTVHRWMAKEGAGAIPSRLFQPRFPSEQPSARARRMVARAASATQNAEEDDWIWTTWRWLYRHATERIPLLDVAEESSTLLAEWERRLVQAQHLRTMSGRGIHNGYRHRMVHFARDRRSPNNRERLPCPVYPHLETDQKWVQILAPRLWKFMEADPILCGRVLEDYVVRIRRKGNLLRFSSPKESPQAQEYLAFLSSLGVSRDLMRFVSFDTAKHSHWIPQWRELLGLNWRHPIEKRPVATASGDEAAASFAIEPVLTPAGEEPSNNGTGSYGFRFLMLMGSILYAGKANSESTHSVTVQDKPA